MADLVKTVQAQNPGLSSDNAAKFAAIAANVYCPNALPATGAKTGPSQSRWHSAHGAASRATVIHF